MKKSFFGLMALLAVCSFVLTSCYNKDPHAKTPSEYYVVGSVYDAETGSVISNATVTLDGKSVGTTFKVKLDSYVPSVTIAASAEGYYPVTRTVSIEKLNEYNQVSVTNVDVALAKIPETPDKPEPDVIIVSKPVAGFAGMTAGALRDLFGINHGEIVMGENGLVEIFMHYLFVDNHLNVDVHTNVPSNSVLGTTHSPYTVTDSLYKGYIWDFTETSHEYYSEIKSGCNEQIGTVNVGTQYKDFANSYEPFSTVLNRDGGICMIGYCVCKDFTLWSIPVSINGVEMGIIAFEAMATHITPIEGECPDKHDNHDNHDNKDDNHDNHDNHNNHHNNHHVSATAWGGGAGDAE